MGWLRSFAWASVALVLFATSAAFGGDVSVRGYTRKDGTYVRPHMRSAPDGNFSNNWSTYGNYNPYTGKPGTKVSPPANYGQPVHVSGYYRADGTYVQPHMRTAPDGDPTNNYSYKAPATKPYAAPAVVVPPVTFPAKSVLGPDADAVPAPAAVDPWDAAEEQFVVRHIRELLAKSRASMRTDLQDSVSLAKQALQSVIGSEALTTRTREQLRNEVDATLRLASTAQLAEKVDAAVPQAAPRPQRAPLPKSTTQLRKDFAEKVREFNAAKARESTAEKPKFWYQAQPKASSK